MSNQSQTELDEMKKLAEQYAKDFHISYDKIRINPKGSVTYRQSGSNSGGWQESGSSVNLPYWVITGHYKQIEEVLDRLKSKSVNAQTYQQADGAQYGSTHSFQAIPLSAIEAERNKLKESKDE